MNLVDVLEWLQNLEAQLYEASNRSGDPTIIRVWSDVRQKIRDITKELTHG